MLILQGPDMKFYRPVFRPGRMVCMNILELIKIVRTEMSEAKKAVERKDNGIAKACMLFARDQITKNIKVNEEN